MQAAGERAPEFLSTHPAPESRIAALEAKMPEALRYYRPRPA
jgi:predicted Zn-dependent protease